MKTSTLFLAAVLVSFAGVGDHPQSRWVATAGAAAQTTYSVTFTGQVVDTYWGNPVVDAVVRLEQTLRPDGSAIIGVTNADGQFLIEDVPTGPSRVVVSRLGYADMAQVVDIREDQHLEIAVIPQPVILEGIEVYVDRLETRLGSLPYIVSTFDEVALQSSPTMDVATYLDDQPNLQFVPCFENSGAGVRNRMPRDCLRARGTQPSRPRIFLDDTPLFGGVQELSSLPTTAMYRIEVIRGCNQIRVYTRHYVEFVVRNPRALLPIICT